eukprot:SAG31_NODE_5417_length_2549_cov_2.290612_4_plen_55_part_00
MREGSAAEAEADESSDDDTEEGDDGRPSMLNITQGTDVQIFWDEVRLYSVAHPN